MSGDKRLHTAADVARRAGVDRSTVSRILNRSFDRHHYSPRTVRAVEQAARALNYRPSTAGRALRSGRTMSIGLIVGDVANNFFGQLAGAIEAGLRAHHYRVMIATTSEEPGVQRAVIDDMLRHGVDGLILSPTGAGGLKLAKARRTPLVFVDRPLTGHDWPYVGIDNYAAGRLLGERLRASGYGRIGVVTPDSRNDPTLRWRLDGLAVGLGDAARIVWRHEAPRSHEVDARHPLVTRLSQPRRAIDAIVGLTNDTTVMALQAARDAKLRVPHQIGLAGIDDFRAAELLDPPLTVVAQPIDLIAAKTAERLLAAMAGNPCRENCLLPPHLIERRSLTV